MLFFLEVRRKVPAVDSQRILLYDSTVAATHAKVLRRQLLLTEAFKSLHLRASQRANSLTGESEAPYLLLSLNR